MRRWAVLLILAAAGCGSNDNGNTGGFGGAGGSNPPPHVPQTYTILPTTRINQPADTVGVSPATTVPSGATFTYQVVDRTPTFTADHFDVIVLVPALASSFTGPGAVTGYAEQDSASNATATTPPVAAGTYQLAIHCINFVDDCILDVGFTTFY